MSGDPQRDPAGGEQPRDDAAGTEEPGPAADPARALLDRLRRGGGESRRRTPSGRTRRREVLHPDEQVWSPAASGERDPSALSDSVDGLVAEQGWRRTIDEASLAPRWPAIVGPTLAEHTRPEALTAGELVVRASSTAWATQIRMMAREVIRRIAAEVGDDVVTRIRVIGPTGPDWRHGPLRVRGRGPRDTYG